jgi:hypothetical protein
MYVPVWFIPTPRRLPATENFALSYVGTAITCAICLWVGSKCKANLGGVSSVDIADSNLEEFFELQPRSSVQNDILPFCRNRFRNVGTYLRTII